MTTGNTPLKLLDNKQAAALLGIKPGTLAIWRTLGKSPRFIKVGKLVRYYERDIHTWLDANTHASTSHRGFQAY